ncbi:MAG: antitoxin MazE family protein [Magnetovibrionaceae bacterium]
MSEPVAKRVKKRRDALREQSLRPVQIWVPDTRISGVNAEIRCQCLLVARADRADQELQEFMDDALKDAAEGRRSRSAEL